MLKSGANKISATNTALREFYVEYYNKHMLRNIRFLYDKEHSFVNDEGETIKYEATSLNADKYGDTDDSMTRAPNWIVDKCRAKYGTLAGEITHYNNIEDFKRGKIADRYCDRLFFDFDIDDNPQVKELKAEFKRANANLDGRPLQKKYVELQRSFRQLIFEDDLLKDVFDEAKRLIDMFLKLGLQPFFVSRGSKGFHVLPMFEDMKITNLSDIQKTLARTYSKQLNLHYTDFKVFDRTRAHKRLQRLPYGIHSKTGLITRPLDTAITYDDMLEEIKNTKRRPVDFDFNDYIAPQGFNKMIVRLDNEISFKKAERQKQLARENREKTLALQKKYGKNYKSFKDIDLREIARAYGIEGKREASKTIVNCPFHHDVHPSAVVYPERFYCSTCAMSLNYYEFVSRLEGTDDKDKIIEVLRRFL